MEDDDGRAARSFVCGTIGITGFGGKRRAKAKSESKGFITLVKGKQMGADINSLGWAERVVWVGVWEYLPASGWTRFNSLSV